jgi:hypothetical protein
VRTIADTVTPLVPPETLIVTASAPEPGCGPVAGELFETTATCTVPVDAVLIVTVLVAPLAGPLIVEARIITPACPLEKAEALTRIAESPATPNCQLPVVVADVTPPPLPIGVPVIAAHVTPFVVASN